MMTLMRRRAAMLMPLLGFMTALLFLGTVARAYDVNLTITPSVASGPTPSTIAVGDTTKTSFTVNNGNPQNAGEAQPGTPAYSWSFSAQVSDDDKIYTPAPDGSYVFHVDGGDTASPMLTATLKTADYWKIIATATVSYKDKNGSAFTWGGSGSCDVKVTVVSVGIVATDLKAGSLLPAGTLCLNAQDEYKHAKWKAIVLPDGATAKVTVASGSQADVSVAGGAVSNGQLVDVSGGSKAGTYKLLITANGDSQCTKTSDDAVAFKFVSVLNGPSLPQTSPPPDDGKGNFGNFTDDPAPADFAGGQYTTSHHDDDYEPDGIGDSEPDYIGVGGLDVALSADHGPNPPMEMDAMQGMGNSAYQIATEPKNSYSGKIEGQYEMDYES